MSSAREEAVQLWAKLEIGHDASGPVVDSSSGVAAVASSIGLTCEPSDEASWESVASVLATSRPDVGSELVKLGSEAEVIITYFILCGL